VSGIAGVWRLDGGPADPEAFEPVLGALTRRGPDRQRALHSSGASLGQALLATTPEAREERQPWVHDATGAVVVTDSRLDNRDGLLASLGLLNRPAASVGDAELIFEAVMRWGPGAAERLLGDFAFAVWEPSNRRLLLGRDSFGVRPLFYHHQPGKLFAFASSAEALLAVRDIPRTLDEGRLADALVGELEGVDSTCTFPAALRPLAHAHPLRCEARGPPPGR